MIVRDTSLGFIHADITLEDAYNLLRALDRQSKADQRAHPEDAGNCRRMRDELDRAVDQIKKQARKQSPFAGAGPRDQENKEAAR